MINALNECFISVDVETAGPVPVEYSLLSIGACLVEDDALTFECLLKPTTKRAVSEALGVTGLSLDALERDGLSPAEAMGSFAEWVSKVAKGRSPVFVGFNASFDWAFVNYYFHHYLGSNPFGFAALDIKSVFMGISKCSWGETRYSVMAKKLRPQRVSNHNALEDAIAQAEMFRLVMSHSSSM